VRTLLVVPPVAGAFGYPGAPHVGIGYLAGMLRANNYPVKVLDMRLDYEFKDLAKRVKEFKPDLIGLTCVSNHYRSVYKLIDEIKKLPDAPLVVIGGPHVSTIREKVLEESKADYAIIGEGEYTLLELVSGKPVSKINGLAWKNGKKVVKNPERPFIKDLDSLPFPAYELFELDKYLTNKIPMVTSRGCPYNCTYCSIKLVAGRGFRPRSPENVIEEMQHWYDLGYREFAFGDDCFSFDLDRAKKICDLIAKKDWKIKWYLRNGIRVDCIDQELVCKMKTTGLQYVALGVESADEEVLKKIKKGITPEQVERAAEMFKKAGIKIGGFFIIGLPGETFEKFKKSLNFAKRIGFDEIRFYNVFPYPGTELYEWMKENATILRNIDDCLNDISYFEEEPIYETDSFPREQRIKAFRIAESQVAKAFLKKEFGKLGYILWFIWKAPLMKGFARRHGTKIIRAIRKI